MSKEYEKIGMFLLIILNGRISRPSQGSRKEKGKENEQTLANLSPAEKATSKDEIEIDCFVPLLSCLAI